ncbi:adenosylcobinamide-GDP ribazoletransferase [Rhodanobacter sp. A1T4]|nr:adenosylcobinamide-GDP ribazoletransferase [Rhodanobacter sp. A1T4]
MRSLLAALGFLTRVPVPAWVFKDAGATNASLAWYPTVGLLIGGVLWGLAWIGSSLPPLLLAALLLLVWTGLTGALHLDGLADSADAWVGGLGDRERTLAIMKDPRSGPMGVTAVVLVLLLKFAALASLPLADTAIWLAPMLARTAITAAFLSMPYVRSQGLGSALTHSPRLPCIVGVLAAVAVAACSGSHGARALLAASVVFACWRFACMHRLGGMTGDTLGALTELAEVLVLIVLV